MGSFGKNILNKAYREVLANDSEKASSILKKVMDEHAVTEIWLVNDLSEDESLMFSGPKNLRFRAINGESEMFVRFTRFCIEDGEIMFKFQVVAGEDDFDDEFQSWQPLSGLSADLEVVPQSVEILKLAKWIEEEYDICEEAAKMHSATASNDGDFDDSNEKETPSSDAYFDDFDYDDEINADTIFNNPDEEIPAPAEEPIDEEFIAAIKSKATPEEASKELERIKSIFNLNAIRKLGLWTKTFLTLYPEKCAYNEVDEQLFANVTPDFFFNLFVGKGKSDTIFAVKLDFDTLYFLVLDTKNKTIRRIAATEAYENPEKYQICFDDVIRAIYKAIEFNTEHAISEEKWGIAHLPVINPYSYRIEEESWMNLPSVNPLSVLVTSMHGIMYPEDQDDDVQSFDDDDEVNEEDIDEDDDDSFSDIFDDENIDAEDDED